MKQGLLTSVILLLAIQGFTQNNAREALQQGDDAFKNGEYEKAFEKYFAAQAFDPNQRDESKKRIAKVLKKAEQDGADARAAEQKAKSALKLAQAAKGVAQSEIEKANKAVLTTFANDLVYKSQVALPTDRNGAFRLAEFAHLYLDADNPRVTTALLQSLYSSKNKTDEWGERFTGHSDIITAIACSPDGKSLATASVDGKAILWDAETQKNILVLDKHKSPVLDVAFSADGKYIATGYKDNTAIIWDSKTGDIFQILSGHNGAVNAVAFSADSKKLVTASDDNTAIVWTVHNGKMGTVFKEQHAVLTSIAFSRNGKKVVTGGQDNNAYVWNPENGKVSLILSGHTGSVNSVAYSADSKMIATGSADKTAIIWDASSGKKLHLLKRHIDEVLSVSFSTDGTKVATGAADKMGIIWDLASGKPLTTLMGHNGKVNSIAFFADDLRIATASADKTAIVWDLDAKEIIDDVHKKIALPALSSARLMSYGLDDLLDLRPDNEDVLIATGEVNQIAAFADLYVEKIQQTGFPRRADYDRAIRLYEACIKIGGSETVSVYQPRIDDLKRLWAEKSN